MARRLSRPPEACRPDRVELIATSGTGVRRRIHNGVLAETLVHCVRDTEGLGSGVMAMDAGSRLESCTCAGTMAMTVLSGNVTVHVGDSRLSLDTGDNVALLGGTVHSIVNECADASATMHCDWIAAGARESAWTVGAPERATGDGDIACDSGRRPVVSTRLAEAGTYDAGTGTVFVDYVNDGMLMGAGLSGGHGVFAPGGRLPAHFHEFDEIISIIGGTATCFVEGRRYVLQCGDIAMIPRGRAHFFRNEHSAPMTMLWYYAADMPERIVVDEACATEEGVAWGS